MNQYFAFNKFHKFCLALAMGFSLFGLSSCGDSDDKNPGGISISDKTVSGVSQKGPFVKGSSVHVYELDLNTLAQTGNSYTGKIASDKGDFKVNIANLASQYALLEAEGYYRNEITGKLSSSPITLNAITDLSDRDNVNINLLTHLEFERVQHLVNEGMSLVDAKKYAEEDIFNSFYVDGSFEKFEELNIFSEGPGDAALLAVSILLQSDRSEAQLSELLAEYALDIEKDGTWDDEKTKTAIADWAEKKTFADGLAEIRAHVEVLNFGKVPAFEEIVQKYWWRNYGLGDCNEAKSGKIMQNMNALSNHYKTFYVCDSRKWQYATAFEIDTYDWGTGTDGDVKYGNVNSTQCYVFDEDSWRVGEKNDCTLGISGCTVNRQNIVSQGSDGEWYVCLTSGWQRASDIQKDTLSWGTNYKEGAVKNGTQNTRTVYVFDGSNWRLGTELDSLMVKNGGRACAEKKNTDEGMVAVLNDTSSVKVDGLYYVCGDRNQWVVAPELYNDTYEAREECSQETEGIVVEGRVNGHNKYVCEDNSWRLFNSVEKMLDSPCVAKKDGKTLSKNEDYYVCLDLKWKLISEVEYIFGFCNEDREYETAETEYVCQNGSWRQITDVEKKDGFCLPTREGDVSEAGFMCHNGQWRKATTLEKQIGFCLEENKGKVVEFTQQRPDIQSPECGYGPCMAEFYRDSESDGFLRVSVFHFKCDGMSWHQSNNAAYEQGILVSELGTCSATNEGVIVEHGSYYVCQKNLWKKITVVEYENGFCTADRNDEIIDNRYVCQNESWRELSEAEQKGGFCTADRENEIIDNQYVCQNKSWRKLSEAEQKGGFCIAGRENEIVDNQYVCQNKSWRELNVIEKEDGLCIGSRKGDVIEFVYGAPSLNLGYNNIAHSNEYICKNGSCRDNWLYYLECDGESWKFTSKNIYEQYVWTKALGECSVEKNEQVVEYQESVSEGNLVTWNTVYYACVDLKWRVATKLEYTHGVCNSVKTNETIKFDNKYFGCSENNWEKISELESIVIPQQGFCLHEINQKNVDVNGKSIVCEAPSGNGFWREKTDVEIANDMCSLSRQDEITNYDEQVYVCKSEHWVSIDKLGLYELPQEVFFNPDIEYGTLTDARDGNVYKTVQIGTQEWMAENLRLDAGIHSGCYSERYDSEKYCQLGRMYSVDVADALCPDGWHLPNGEEWETLIASVDDKSELLGSYGWEKLNVTNVNKSGFSIVPMAVGWSFFNGTVHSADSWSDGPRTFFWSFSENLADRDIPLHAFVGNSDVGFKMDLGYPDWPDEFAFYVRCVKDSAE